MELFLVRANVSYRRYMHDKDEEFDDIRLVRAKNEEYARSKYEDYWYGKDSAYEISYYVRIHEISGVIE